tara:strand:+ start:7690 stop:8424 length:735 start_codon:yes stop_codon:yes gene_type:complete
MTIRSDLLKHKILVNRYARGRSNKLEKNLGNLRNYVIRQVNKFGSLSTKQINKLHEILTKSLAPIVANQLNGIKNYYDYEAKFSAKVFKKHYKTDKLELPKSNNKDIEKIKTSFVILGAEKTLEASFDSFTTNKINSTIQILKDAQVNRAEPEMLIQSIYNLYNGQVKTQAKTLVLNAVLSTMQKVRDDIKELNDIPIERVVWAVDLDSNICDYCLDLDGEVFEWGDNPPCPAHANCNCELIPL